LKFLRVDLLWALQLFEYFVFKLPSLCKGLLTSYFDCPNSKCWFLIIQLLSENGISTYLSSRVIMTKRGELVSIPVSFPYIHCWRGFSISSILWNFCENQTNFIVFCEVEGLILCAELSSGLIFWHWLVEELFSSQG
jgi:hypothetical protein